MIETVNGVKVAYDITGSGDKTIVTLHGWGCDRHIFDGVTARLPGVRVVGIDLPGFGESPEPPASFGVAEYAAAVYGLMERVGVLGADVLCHSNGARVAIWLSSHWPKSCGKIVFAGPAGVRLPRKPKQVVKIYSFKLMRRLSRFAPFVRIMKAAGVDVHERIKNAGSEDYRNASPVMRQIMSRLINHDLTPNLKDVASPSLIIIGEEDTATPVRMGEIMEKRIPDAGLVVLKNAGHYCFLDQFGSFVKIISTFYGV